MPRNFQNYLNSNCNLRINKKTDYNLADDWESAAYYLPITDDNLQSAEISNEKSLIFAPNNNKHKVDRNY